MRWKVKIINLMLVDNLASHVKAGRSLTNTCRCFGLLSWSLLWHTTLSEPKALLKANHSTPWHQRTDSTHNRLHKYRYSIQRNNITLCTWILTCVHGQCHYQENMLKTPLNARLEQLMWSRGDQIVHPVYPRRFLWIHRERHIYPTPIVPHAPNQKGRVTFKIKRLHTH
jgi:hypothetical protein